ncbi:T9SS C-terminal target domain-containing protein, partial [archaeon]|nr:T9SS C-terminal target domain-containing protein [archaeon]
FSFFGAKLEPKGDLNIGGETGVNYQWNIKGIGNKTSSDLDAEVYYTLPSDGSYDASLIATTAEYGCVCKSSLTIVMDRLLVNENNLKIEMYPVPADVGKEIQCTANQRVISFYLIDASGKEVLNNKVGEKSFKINTNGLSNGVYFLNVITYDGDSQYKIILK